MQTIPLSSPFFRWTSRFFLHAHPHTHSPPSFVICITTSAMYSISSILNCVVVVNKAFFMAESLGGGLEF